MARQWSGIHLYDELSGLTHTTYDDIRIDCGIYWSMYNKTDYKFVEAPLRVPTCVACVALRAVYPLLKT